MTGYRVETVAADAATKSCRRPLKVGLYDASVERTFVCWMGAECAAFVAARDHADGTWSDPKRVGTSYRDYHNYPHLIQTDDGRLHVFHGCHNTVLRQATASEPHSIGGEWSDGPVEAAPEASYPMPFVAEDGSLFVFFRRTDDVDDRPMAYVRSTDAGRTWEDSEALTGDPIALGHRDRPDNMDEIYVGQLRHEPADAGREGRERVHLVWTLAGGGREGREHDRYHRNLYHATFSPGDLHFRAADGTDLGTWLDREDGERHCKVLDTGEPEGLDVDYVQYVHYTAGGRPVLAFGGAPAERTAAWTGTEWTLASGPETGEYTGGFHDLERTGPESFRLYADHDEGLQIFESDDGGQRWHAGDVVAFPAPLRHAVVVDDYREPVRLLATEATDWDSFALDRDLYATGRAE